MKIIEIKSLENGGHRNQTGTFFEIPEGWARIPDDMELPNFPFGEVETKDEDVIKIETVTKIETVDGVEVPKREKVEKVIGTRKVVTKWTPGIVPEVEPTPEPEATTEEIINILLGVE